MVICLVYVRHVSTHSVPSRRFPLLQRRSPSTSGAVGRLLGRLARASNMAPCLPQLLLHLHWRRTRSEVKVTVAMDDWEAPIPTRLPSPTKMHLSCLVGFSQHLTAARDSVLKCMLFSGRDHYSRLSRVCAAKESECLKDDQGGMTIT